MVPVQVSDFGKATTEDLGLDKRWLAEAHKVARAGGMDFAASAIEVGTEAEARSRPPAHSCCAPARKC